MTLRNGKVLEIERGSTKSYSVEILLCGELALEEAMDLMQGRLRNEVRSTIRHLVTYGAEVWTASMEEKNTLRIFEGQIARKICGPVKEGGHLRRRTNKEKGTCYKGQI